MPAASAAVQSATAIMSATRSFSAYTAVDWTPTMPGGSARGGLTSPATGGVGSTDWMALASPALGGCGATGVGEFGLASARGSGVFSPGGACGGGADPGAGGAFASGSGEPIVVAISLLNSGKI